MSSACWFHHYGGCCREERGLTRKEAAQLANVYHETLIYLESGKREPYMPTLTKIARAYGVSIEELVEEQ